MGSTAEGLEGCGPPLRWLCGSEGPSPGKDAY